MCTQPCYFGGPFALNLATDKAKLIKQDAKDIAARLKSRKIKHLKYWTPQVHAASFALPAYAEAVVNAAIKDGRKKGEQAEGYRV